MKHFTSMDLSSYTHKYKKNVEIPTVGTSFISIPYIDIVKEN